MKLWHDDVRPAPKGWIWVRNNDEAKDYLMKGLIRYLDLDHDLGADKIKAYDYLSPEERINLMGTSEDNGMRLVQWMIQYKVCPTNVNIHSWNAPRALQMFQMLQKAFPSHNITYIPYSAEYWKSLEV